jgi:glycerate 2-kinase
MLPRGQHHPFELDTFGLGAAIQAAAKQGARRCFVGIGGSATNDGGFGLARALGWKFLDTDDRELTRWIDLPRLERLCAPKQQRWFPQLLIAVDVQNKLLGAHGCSRVYGPQKGLRLENFPVAERALRRLATAVRRLDGEDAAAEPGAGAAGGLGFGLRAFAGGAFTSGFDLFARLSHLHHRMKATDLVITAEGRIDRSTLMGKGVGGVAQMARALRKPCLGFAGVLGDREQLLRRFSAAHALAPDFVPIQRALSRPADCLERLAAKIAGTWRG